VVADALAVALEEKIPLFSYPDTTFSTETIAVMVQQGFQIAANLSRQIQDGESAAGFVKRILSERDRAEARLRELVEAAELIDILRRYPVRIVNTDRRLAVEPLRDGWSNPPIMARLSHLVFFDDDVAA
jgi:hypothetical protein